MNPSYIYRAPAWKRTNRTDIKQLLADLIPTAVVLLFWSIFVFFLAMPQAHAAPSDFDEAKKQSRTLVYFDRNDDGDLYCECNWRWVGKSAGRIIPDSCGVSTRAQPVRSARIEWEHIVPAHAFGHQRQCWRTGGRRNCESTDPVFKAMEADLHNLTPVVGELNADRSNYRFGMIEGEPRAYGRCDFEVDFKRRVAEPPEQARGMIARAYLYMHEKYQLSMSKSQQQLMTAWNRQYPPTAWELERDSRIARIMGTHNPFVVNYQR